MTPGVARHLGCRQTWPARFRQQRRKGSRTPRRRFTWRDIAACRRFGHHVFALPAMRACPFRIGLAREAGVLVTIPPEGRRVGDPPRRRQCARGSRPGRHPAQDPARPALRPAPFTRRPCSQLLVAAPSASPACRPLAIDIAIAPAKPTCVSPGTRTSCSWTLRDPVEIMFVELHRRRA